MVSDMLIRKERRELTCETGVCSNADVRGLLVLRDDEVEHALFACDETVCDVVRAEALVVGITTSLFPNSKTM